MVYKLETDSDAKSYLEMRTQLGQSNMKARIDRSENDFQIAIYKVSNHLNFYPLKALKIRFVSFINYKSFGMN